MIDLNNLASYRENNRIEAKRALGGFPHSVWETYSAFANTLGGIILLGVEERKDHSLHAVNLPAPEKLVQELWENLNNPFKVSVNILSGKNVSIENVDGKRIIVITVPRALRYDKPVYIGGNAQSGTYRRNGEGDYRCPDEEIEAMLRDAALKTPDMRVLENSGLDALDIDSVHRYRRRMHQCRPEHVWERSDDDSFLYNLGAVGRGGDGKLHPTAAGLLMFGTAEYIVKQFPDFALGYFEYGGESISSASGDWSGNIFDFYLRAYKKITQNLKAQLGAGGNIDESLVNNALKEALANCLINADYYGKNGIKIKKGRDGFTFSNPGSFRVDVDAAKSGGVSDPRNGALLKMFNLIDIGNGNGSGLPHIFAVWERHGWLTPSISESFDPERITLTLSIGRTGDKNCTLHPGAKTLAQKAAIVEYLTDHASGTGADLSKLLGIDGARTEELLADLIASDIVVPDGTTYRLKR